MLDALTLQASSLPALLSQLSLSPDQLRAEAAIRKAAKAGNAEAQFRLGVMYGNGDGVALDYQQAQAYAGIGETRKWNSHWLEPFR